MRIFTRISFDPDKLLRQKRDFRLLAVTLFALSLGALLPNSASRLHVILFAAGTLRLWPALTGRSSAFELLALVTLAAGGAIFAGMPTQSVLSAYLALSGACKCLEWRRVKELSGSMSLLLGGIADMLLCFVRGSAVFSFLPGEVLALHLAFSAGTASSLSGGYARLERIMRTSIRPRVKTEEEVPGE